MRGAPGDSVWSCQDALRCARAPVILPVRASPAVLFMFIYLFIFNIYMNTLIVYVAPREMHHFSARLCPSDSALISSGDV